MTLQVPTPPAPPFDPNLLFMDPEIIFAIVVAGLIVSTIILLPIMRALAHRLEGRSTDSAVRNEIAEVRERLAEVDALQTRVAELEERLEFTERLLAQGQQQGATAIRGERS